MLRRLHLQGAAAVTIILTITLTINRAGAVTITLTINRAASVTITFTVGRLPWVGVCGVLAALRPMHSAGGDERFRRSAVQQLRSVQGV